MAADLILGPDVEQDIEAGYAWYEKRRTGLGEDFLNRIDACVQEICRSPELYAKVHQEYRRALVRRFPYAIFYEFANGVITIYSVFHTSRDPTKWRDRLP